MDTKLNSCKIFTDVTLEGYLIQPIEHLPNLIYLQRVEIQQG